MGYEWDLPSGILPQFANLKMAIESSLITLIYDLPMNSMVIFHSYVNG